MSSEIQYLLQHGSQRRGPVPARRDGDLTEAEPCRGARELGGKFTGDVARGVARLESGTLHAEHAGLPVGLEVVRVDPRSRV